MADLLMARKEWRALTKSVSDATKQFGLSPAQYLILEELRGGDKTVSEIAERMETSLAFVTTTLNNLEAREWVKRTTSEEDARSNVVSLVRVEEFDAVKEIVDALFVEEYKQS